MRRRIGLTALVLLTAACSPYRLIGPPQASVGNLSVDPQVAWSTLGRGKLVAWTVDGFPLQRVHLLGGLGNGEALPGARSTGSRVFRSGMTPADAMELFMDALSEDFGYQQLETKNLRPRPFGRSNGFGFDFSLVDRNGLEGQGMAAGTILDGRLYLIVYSGVRGHYFSRYRATVERMIDSARIDAGHP